MLTSKASQHTSTHTPRSVRRPEQFSDKANFISILGLTSTWALEDGGLVLCEDDLVFELDRWDEVIFHFDPSFNIL